MPHEDQVRRMAIILYTDSGALKTVKFLPKICRLFSVQVLPNSEKTLGPTCE